MCGFVLVYAKHERSGFTQSALDAMDRAIMHRGPDEHGQRNIGPIFIGHRRLAIVDLHGGKQPMASPDQKTWITFNGEIYNFRDVRDELEKLGHRFAEQSDTEVLLTAWRQWGEACLEKLDGMFAFAVYDVERGVLTAVRDAFGEKPLYYTETENALYLASELKALVAAGVVSKNIDASALYSYFTLGYVTGDQSIFRNVRRLQPGHVLTYSPNDGVRERPWWRPPAFTDEICDIDEVVTGSLDILRDSVRHRMISDVPLGFFLSGGVDSSAIVALAAEATSDRLETFSIGFDDPQLDERPHAKFVAQRFGTRHHEFVVMPKHIDVLEQIAWHADEPFADQAALPTWFLSEQTRKSVTVALSGDGGDELFAGYDVYRSHGLSERIRQLPAPIRKLAVASLRALTPVTRDSRRLLRLAKNIEDAALDAADRFVAKQQSVFRRDFLANASGVLALFATAAGDKSIFAPLYDGQSTALDAIALWQQTVSLPDDMLHKVDRMSMAHSLEVRAPFLNRRLVELLNRTSFDVKLNGGRQKYVLRKAMEKYLPKDFLWRPKQGFVVPLSRWFKGDLEQFTRDQLMHKNSIVSAVISSQALERILGEHARSTRDWGQAIWAMLMFEQWCRTYGIDPSCVAR